MGIATDINMRKLGPNPEHLKMFEKGAKEWNRWRDENPNIRPNLANAHISYRREVPNHEGSNFSRVSFDQCYFKEDEGKRRGDISHAPSFAHANFSNASFASAIFDNITLTAANFTNALLFDTNIYDSAMQGCDLTNSQFVRSRITNVNLQGAILDNANFSECILKNVNLAGSTLKNTVLKCAGLVNVDLRGALLLNCDVYGTSSWDLIVDETTKMRTLSISNESSNIITVDSIELAQFIYLLLNNKQIRNVIDTITSKVVLILGRFSPERKPILDALRNFLSKLNYTPIVFDFDKPTTRDLTETISTLAHLSKFIIADITDAKSIPQELQAIVPNLPSVPVQPILLASEREYAMFEHFRRYPWVLEMYYYPNQAELISSLEHKVIMPAEDMSRKLGSGT